MSQRKYALEMISKTDLAGSKQKDTPMEQNLKLTSMEFDSCISEGNHDEALVDRGSSQRLIGKLLYLTITRRDISYAVQYLSQFMHAPKRSNYEAALHVERYIKKQPCFGLLMSSKSEEQIYAFCDFDWASCPMSRKSVTRYCIKLGNSLIF
ncbi:putative mitochondrial protein AtMg00240 [Nicotiana tabacum]|uniref:Mitochondrial protein AtMg00240 n=1 Tax=Nicotiana tabacum TaxID=4097 RepID=A0AC58UHC4_TOBAC